MRVAPLFLLLATLAPQGDDKGWVELAGPNGLKAWKAPHGDWADASEVRPDPANPKRLAYQPGSGILVNGRTGRTRNIVTTEDFGDIEAHIEFMIPKGSNAGVKFEGLYEIQIFDSYGKAQAKGDDCGGIYPRAELLPTYHHIDDGYPPRVNACRPAGEWQTLDVTFFAPRFDADKKKIKDARFAKVVLNGQLIHENQSVPGGTGHAYHQKEIPAGPILLQADHGPVAFRSVKVRPLDAAKEPAK